MIPPKFIRATKWALALSLIVTVTALAQKFTSEADQKEASNGNGEALVATVPSRLGNFQRPPAPLVPSLVGTNQGIESEPNNTFATADVLSGTEGKIKGNNFSGAAPANAGNDEDWYSFTTTVAASKVYAATMTAFSTGLNTTLTVFASDGSTVLETDTDDGSLGTTSSSIAGTTLATAGTYYLRVTSATATTPVAPYDLYFAVRSGSPTAETEPNNNGGPQALPAAQYVSGGVDPVGDTDTFTFTANAGDTVFLSLDLDPERDLTTFNGRIGLGLFGTPPSFLASTDTSTGSAANPLSEAFFMTVDTTGTYVVYVDSQAAGGGGPTATYNFNVTTIPALPAGTCTTYTNSTSTPIADLALTSSSIIIPDSKVIRSLRVVFDATHANFPDLDFHLRSPLSNDNGLVTDVGVATQTGPQNVNLDDEAAVPGAFTVLNGIIFKPEVSYRLDWFKGENSLGTWTLDIRDDTSTNTGTLNSWSLEVCEEPALAGSVVYSQDFEANNGGYTLGPGVTANEWEYGTPATAATSTSTPIAPFLNCASGTGCWKTDLDGTYEVSSLQDLTSPSIPLAGVSGPINLYWQARFQMENVSFDRIWVRVTEVGNPANTRLVWHADNATMTDAVGSPVVNIGASAGWGRYSADISDFAGLNIQVTFHLESDISANFAGWAIDDVSVRGVTCTPEPFFQEVEPNNSIATANTLPKIQGAEVRGGITPAGDQDFFSFQASAGDRIWAYVVTEGATTSTDSILTLFNSAGAVVQLDDDNGFQSTLSSAIAGGVIPTTGTYTLQVRQFGGATILNPYTLYIDRRSGATVPEGEPNDTFATANAYTYGTVVAGAIPNAADQDHYTFTVAQNEKVIIQVDGDPDRNGTNLNRMNQFNPNLDLLDNTGALITAVDSDSQGGNGGLLSENLVFTNTSATATTFAVRIKADPSAPVDDDLGIYNLHIYRVTSIPCLTLTSAVSRKIHGGFGPFDVDLPLIGSPGIESRRGGGSGGDHTLVFTFDNTLVSGNATVVSGTGTVSGPPTFSGSTMTVNLTGVADVQTISVRLSGVTDTLGETFPDQDIPIAFLLGDTTANRIVNASDVAETKAKAGTVGTLNFRSDFDSSGQVNTTDIGQVKFRSGRSLP